MKKKSVMMLSAALLALGAAVAWAAVSSQAMGKAPASEAAAVMEQTASVSEPAVEEVSVFHAYEEPWPLEKLMEKSTLVVRGTVEGADVLEVSGVRGGSLTMTEYQVKVSEVLRGQAEDSVAVLRIGDPESKEMIYETEPILEQGKEYTLFLQSRNLGGDFNFRGDYYRVLGDRQGVYESVDPEPSKASGDILNQKELVAASSEETLSKAVSYAQVQRELKRVNAETPPDPDLFRSEYVKALQSNLETGFITEEEYETAMAELDQYAEVISRRSLWK